jgi:ribonuclease P protein component
MNETHIPTQQDQTSSHLRIPQENENGHGQKDCQSPPPPRAQKAGSLTFPKKARLLKKREFQALLKGEQWVGAALIFGYRRGKNLSPRLGITVSRRFGKAYLRNRFKRVVREAFRHTSPGLPKDVEIHILPRHKGRWMSAKAALDDFTALQRRL